MKPRKRPRSITILDVARRAGVSFKTVSRVINGEPNVRPEMRARVQRAVSALGYRPNVSARALAGSRSFVLALLVADPSIGYAAALQTGAAAACRELGYHLLVEQCDPGDTDLRRRVEQLVATQPVDGLILAVPAVDDASVLAAVDRSGIRCVRVAPDREPERTPRVHFDEQAAAAEMTEYLWSLGHRDIGFVRGYPGHAAARLRQAGFEGAMRRLGGKVNRAWLAQGRFDFRSGVAAAESILAAEIRPTAIFASNDDMALGVMAVAARLGMSVPLDLSVAGFDDLQLATVVWPNLTTVHQPIRAMGAAAVHILANGSADPRGAPVVRMLDHAIVARGSTAPPRRARSRLRRQRV